MSAVQDLRAAADLGRCMLTQQGRRLVLSKRNFSLVVALSFTAAVVGFVLFGAAAGIVWFVAGG